MGAAAGGAAALRRQQMMAAVMRQMQGRMNQGQSLFKPPSSNETSLVGNRQLPTSGRTITPLAGVKGGYDVAYDGNSVGQLLRGGANGRFTPNGNMIPGGLQGQGPPPMPVPGQPPGMPMQLGGMGGGMQPQRQYAPNPFQQQMTTAQMIRGGPISVDAPPQKGGLQYG